MSIELGLRLLERDAGLELAEDGRGWSGARWIQRIVDPPRNPEPRVFRETESVRHHADDRVAFAAELNAAADDRLIRVEAAKPLVVANHQRIGRSRRLVFGQQVSAA